jgi:hypothetical protein
MAPQSPEVLQAEADYEVNPGPSKVHADPLTQPCRRGGTAPAASPRGAGCKVTMYLSNCAKI